MAWGADALASAKSGHHLLDNSRDGVTPAVKHTGVGVTLQCLPLCPSNLVRLRRVMQPVQADSVVAGVTQVVECVPRPFRKHRHGYTLETELGKALGNIVGDVGKIWE